MKRQGLHRTKWARFISATCSRYLPSCRNRDIGWDCALRAGARLVVAISSSTSTRTGRQFSQRSRTRGVWDVGRSGPVTQHIPLYLTAPPRVPATGGASSQGWRVPRASTPRASTVPSGSAQAQLPFSVRYFSHRANDNVVDSASPDTGRPCDALSSRRSVAPSSSRRKGCRSSANRAAVHGVHPWSSPLAPLPPGMTAPTIA